MLWGWEGSRRTGVSLAMHHIGISTGAHGLRKADEHPADAPEGVWHALSFLLLYSSRNYTVKFDLK